MQRLIPVRQLLPIIALAAASAGVAAPLAGPVPPCAGNEAWPLFPPPGAPPAIKAWGGAELEQAAWIPPPCTGWQPSSRSEQVVALAGTFQSVGGMDALLARIGAISSLREVRYWSSTEKAWRPMALDAAALSGADPESRRPDFSAAEFGPDRPLYYWMNDYRVGSVVYRIRVLERRGEDRAVLTSENVSPARVLFVTLFRPGMVQAVEFIQRLGPDLWQVYLLARIDRRASRLLRDQEASSANRLLALYRLLADIPTDQEPPAFP